MIRGCSRKRHDEGRSASRDHSAHLIDRGVHHGNQRDQLCVQAQRPRRDPRAIEDIVDEPTEHPRVPFDDVQRAKGMLRCKRFFEVLSPTYHIPITIELLTCARVALSCFGCVG